MVLETQSESNYRFRTNYKISEVPHLNNNEYSEDRKVRLWTVLVVIGIVIDYVVLLSVFVISYISTPILLKKKKKRGPFRTKRGERETLCVCMLRKVFQT